MKQFLEELYEIKDKVEALIERAEEETETTPAKSTKGAKDKTETKKPVSKALPGKKAKVVEEDEEDDDNDSDVLSEKELKALSYNDLKKYAKEHGITAVGSRDQLVQKILDELSGGDSDDQEQDEVETKSSKKATKPSGSKKLGGKKQPEPEPEDEEDDEPADDIEELVNSAVEDMEDEEIAEMLTEAGVKNVKGKRQALISLVVKAVRDGKIDLGSEDDEEEDDDQDEDDETENDFGDVNDLDNPDMTDERKAGIEAYVADAEEMLENGDLSRKDMVAWLNEYHGTKDKMKDVSDEDLFAQYVHYSCLFIDDEGEMPEEQEAYTVNGENYCCGHELQYDKKRKAYICGHCDNEYEAE